MNTRTKNRQSRSSSNINRRRNFSNSNSNNSINPHRGRFHSARAHHGNYNASRRGGQNRPARKMPTFDPTRFINTNPVETAPETYISKHSFDMFGIDARLVRTVASLDMVSPTPIQDQIIPEVLKGRDVIGLAETGTGKTAAFLLPLIERTLKGQSKQTLILVPTRELALQIEEELRKLSIGLRLSSVTCVGGVNIRPQIQALRYSNHFIIGTPGRILDLINRKYFKLSDITTVVLDEADRMLDMGFIHDMKAILSSTPKNRGTLLFSATMSKGAEELARDFLRNPIVVSVKKKDVINSIEQGIVSHGHNNKFETLRNLLLGEEFKRVLVFGSMKHSVEKLAKQLSKTGIYAESIHGNKSHGARQQALKKFKNGGARVLVATDVAARGIHVEDVTHVINYDLPSTFEDYVHRIGRTGRNTKRGKALTFVVTKKA